MASVSARSAWWLAIRPATLTASAAPVLVGTGAAWADGAFAAGPAFAALLGASLLRGLFTRPRLLRAVGRLLRLLQRSGLQALARRLGLMRLLPRRLRELGIPHEHVEFDGGHSGLDDRYLGLLPRLIERLTGSAGA